MSHMNEVHELIETPLSRDELAVRYRALCDDPCYANVPGKIELDVGGQASVEAPIATATGLFVSPSNSVKELQEEVSAYISAGAHEAWIVYPQSKRCEFYGKAGVLERSAFEVDLSRLFD